VYVSACACVWAPVCIGTCARIGVYDVRPYVSYFPFSLVEVDIQVYLSPICQLGDILAWIGIWMLFCYSHGILIYLGNSLCVGVCVYHKHEDVPDVLFPRLNDGFT
jgi:hypothetical protein